MIHHNHISCLVASREEGTAAIAVVCTLFEAIQRA